MSIQQESTFAPHSLAKINESTLLGCLVRQMAAGAAFLGRMVRMERRRYRTERELGSLSNALLRDIGVHRWEVSDIARSLSRDERARR